MIPFDDTERHSFTLTRVEQYDDGAYEVQFDGGLSGLIESPDIEPKVGDEFTYWGSKFGPRRGFAINGVVVEYMTKEQQQEQWERENEKRRLKQKKEYAEALESNNERISKLPDVFQDRIELFREYSPDWGYLYEGYELFCCEEAMRLAEAFPTEEALVAFAELDYNGQQEAFASSDQHSGNTWGSSMLYARVYLTDPESIPLLHGAMCPLVGCKDYGCHAERIKQEE